MIQLQENFQHNATFKALAMTARRAVAYVSLTLGLSIVGIGTSHGANQQGYYQDPSLHQDNLVFVSQGDLYKANISSSTDLKAVRISSHENLESAPHISPNGELLAYISSHSGVPAVYVMPMNGGMAKQVSFELSNTKLHGFIDDQHILISTASSVGMHNSWLLKRININSLLTEVLPVADAVEGVISDDGEQLYFTQFGLQLSSDNANYYKGGGKGELWSFNLNENEEAVPLTVDHQGSARSPMLHQGRLFFISNQNGLDNLYSMNTDGSDIRQLTSFDDWAVRDPYMAESKIVFQHGADIKALDLLTNQVSTFAFSLQSDFNTLQTKHIAKPLEYFNDASISFDGEKTLVTARGHMAIAHTDTRRLINLQTDPRSRNRMGVISKDNQYVYAISDASGEYEIWQFDASGRNEAKQLTDDGNILRTGLWLSPNGEYLLHSDKSGKLFKLDLATGKNTLLIDDLSSGFIDHISFSSDSRYISFAYQQRHSERARILLMDLDDDKSAILTEGKYSAYSPSISDDGKWLYFLSDRAFSASPGSPWGDRNMGQHFDKRTQIFAIALSKDAHFPFAPPNELNQLENTEAQDDEEADDTIKVDWNNMAKRLWQVDLPASNYSDLRAVGEQIFVLERNGAGSTSLKKLAFGYPEAFEDVTSGVVNYEVSANAESMLIQKGRGASSKFFVMNVKSGYPKTADDIQVKLDKWTLAIEPRDEFAQMFKDAWLMHRDGLFDPDMRGIDWQATREKYQPLLNRVTERSELNDIFKQMMGELNALHSQVRGGDIARDETAPQMTSLGALLSETEDQNGVIIEHIYDYDRALVAQAPPLAKPGVNAQTQDLITAVNGKSIGNIAQLMQALLNQAGQQVLLDLKRNRETVQTIVVPSPARSETRMRYRDWTQRKLKEVQAVNENIGYLHLYAMGRNDLASFARDFYAQYDKPGLIIDVRRNRGGNIDSIIIEKLMRRAWSFWQSPNGERSTNMQQSFRGHLVVLADQFTYSDGETFTAGVKALDLATVIGKQTAGAGVWLSGGNNVVDGGIARVAEFAVYSMNGDWITEGRGISPDIEVSNLPHATFKGQDAQLEAALAYLQKKLASQPIRKYEAKPLPAVEVPASDIQ